MWDNLALLFVHGALGIVIWRLITLPDLDDQKIARPKPTDRFRRPGPSG